MPELVEALAGLYEVGFAIIASKGGAHWLLSSKEASMLADHTDRVIRYYWPDMPEFHPLIGLGLVGGMIIAPRAMKGFDDPAKPAKTPEAAPEPAPAKGEGMP